MEELENEISTQAEENTVSLASAQALADALAKIEVYTPTTWVDNSSPDIDAEHLNKPEQAIKRVTDALNSAVDVIKDLQSQITNNSGAISDVNNNLSQRALIASVTTPDAIEVSGFYKITGEPGILIHAQWDSNYKFQIRNPYSNKFQFRVMVNNQWGDWNTCAQNIEKVSFAFSEKVAAGKSIEKSLGTITIPTGKSVIGIVVNHTDPSILQGSVVPQLFKNSQCHVCITNNNVSTEQTFEGEVSVFFI